MCGDSTLDSSTISRWSQKFKVKIDDCVWNVTAHAQKPDFVFRAKRKSPFKSAGGRGVSSVDCWQPRCAASMVVMLDTPCSEVVWRVLATHSIRQFPLHFPSRASRCDITFQLESTKNKECSDKTITPRQHDGGHSCHHFERKTRVWHVKTCLWNTEY